MDAILADNIFKKNVNIPLSNNFFFKYVIWDQTDYKPLLAMMGWRITGVKPLPEIIVVLFMDSYIRHSTLM